MCLCHNRWCETIGYRYRNSKKRDVWRVEDLFVLLSFQSCVLVRLFSQLPKAVRNINLNIPHIVFIYFCLSNLKRTATVSSSHRNALFGVCTLISRCSSFSPSLFCFCFWRDYIRSATLKSGDQNQEILGLGKYFLAMLCIWRKTKRLHSRFFVCPFLFDCLF